MRQKVWLYLESQYALSVWCCIYNEQDDCISYSAVDVTLCNLSSKIYMHVIQECQPKEQCCTRSLVISVVIMVDLWLCCARLLIMSCRAHELWHRVIVGAVSMLHQQYVGKRASRCVMFSYLNYSIGSKGWNKNSMTLGPHFRHSESLV